MIDSIVFLWSSSLRSLLGGCLTTSFGLDASIALLAGLFLSHLFLLQFLLFIPPSLWIIVFNNDTVLELFGLQIVQLLSLYNIFETAFVSIAFELVEQMQLVALELLNTLIESRNWIEHLIMLILELKSLLLCLSQLLLDHQDLPLELPIASFFLV